MDEQLTGLANLNPEETTDASEDVDQSILLELIVQVYDDGSLKMNIAKNEELNEAIASYSLLGIIDEIKRNLIKNQEN